MTSIICNDCGRNYKTQNSLVRHSCKFSNYSSTYTTYPEFLILYKHLPVPITIEIIRYVYVTEWHNKKYWYSRFIRLRDDTMGTANYLSNSYPTHYKKIIGWFLIIPLHIIGRMFDIKINRTSIYNYRCQYLNPTLFKIPDYVLFVHAIRNIFEFILNMELVTRLQVTLTLQEYMKKWRKNACQLYTSTH